MVRSAGNGAAAEALPARLASLDRDRPLVAAAQRDPLEFDALYRRYLAQVYSFAYYELGNHHDAEDATERVFLKALAALPRFQERARPADDSAASTFRVWLFQIARNVVATERRTQRRHPVVSLDEAVEVTGPLDPAVVVADRDSVSAALAAVRRLPDDRRRAVLLRFVDQMSTTEIAGVLGRSEGAVRVLIHRGLRGVANDLRSRGR